MPHRFAILPCLILTFLATALSRPAAAAWPAGGRGVCTTSSQSPVVLSDGTGGAFVVWQDLRSGTGDIYAQRVNGHGVPQWSANGVGVCTAAGNQATPFVVADNGGGIVVAWYDGRVMADVYAQRLNGSGVPQWTANGVALTALAGGKTLTGLVSDGAGGAIAVWEDYRSGSGDVYARRVSSAGVPQWTANGSAICTATGDQLLSVIAADGQGGAVIGWADFRASVNADLFAQRVNSLGTALWTANGTPVRSVPGKNAYYPAIASLGADGVVFAWSDDRNFSTAWDIYAQRVTLAGLGVWTNNGIPVAVAGNYQLLPQVVADGAGGVVIGWVDTRSGPQVYAQRLTAGGTELWFGGGTSVSPSARPYNVMNMIADGTGGAIFTWDDNRGGTGTGIYAQRTDASGYAAWQSGDILLGMNTSSGLLPRVTPDAAGGAVVGWVDSRSGSNNIYTQRVERGGNWGFPAPAIVGVRDIPDDQGGQVNLSWNASRLDPWPAQVVYQYSIWRAISPTIASAAVSWGATLVYHDDTDPLSAGPDAIRVEQLGAATYYWKFIKTASAWGMNAYSEDVPTLFDWGAGPGEQQYFQVIAHAFSGFWTSEPDSGHSVDNLAPATPLTLTALRSGNEVLLQWRKSHDADLRDYAVYRATTAGVSPQPGFFVSNALDTLLTDTSAPAGALYYIVTAVDVHENQSAPSNEATVAGAPTGVTPRTPSISTLSVRPNAPNPFTAGTMFDIGLPADTRVDIEVFDVAGRRVRALSAGPKAAGWQQVAFDGRDDDGRALASGVYFYRVRAGGTTVTSKMVITR